MEGMVEQDEVNRHTMRHRKLERRPRRRLESSSAATASPSSPLRTTSHHTNDPPILLPLPRGPHQIYVSQGCLLIPVFLAAWWYYTKRAWHRSACRKYLCRNALLHSPRTRCATTSISHHRSPASAAYLTNRPSYPPIFLSVHEDSIVSTMVDDDGEDGIEIQSVFTRMDHEDDSNSFSNNNARNKITGTSRRNRSLNDRQQWYESSSRQRRQQRQKQRDDHDYGDDGDGWNDVERQQNEMMMTRSSSWPAPSSSHNDYVDFFDTSSINNNVNDDGDVENYRLVKWINRQNVSQVFVTTWNHGHGNVRHRFTSQRYDHSGVGSSGLIHDRNENANDNEADDINNHCHDDPAVALNDLQTQQQPTKSTTDGESKTGSNVGAQAASEDAWECIPDMNEIELCSHDTVPSHHQQRRSTYRQETANNNNKNDNRETHDHLLSDCRGTVV